MIKLLMDGKKLVAGIQRDIQHRTPSIS